jgi:hypothetical protein
MRLDSNRKGFARGLKFFLGRTRQGNTSSVLCDNGFGKKHTLLLWNSVANQLCSVKNSCRHYSYCPKFPLWKCYKRDILGDANMIVKGNHGRDHNNAKAANTEQHRVRSVFLRFVRKEKLDSPPQTPLTEIQEPERAFMQTSAPVPNFDDDGEKENKSFGYPKRRTARIVCRIVPSRQHRKWR